MTSKYDDLEKLADLKNKGIITEEEFNLKKSQILNLDSNKQNINGDNEPTQEVTIKSNQPEKNISTANNGYTKQQSFHRKSGITFKIIGTIISVIILGALIITNPTKADFQNYISNRIQKSSGNAENSGNNFMSALATLAVNQITERDNYFVCSIYTVNTTSFKMFSDKVPDNPKFLGILGQFIPLNVSFKDKGENSDQKAESVSVPVPAQEVSPPASAPQNTTSTSPGDQEPRVSDQINTPYGTMSIVAPEIGISPQLLKFNGQKIKTDDSFSLINFDKKFKFSNSYVVLLSGSCGGNGCGGNDYCFITLKPDKSYSISEKFGSATEYKLKQQGETITLQFDRVYIDDTKEYYDGAMTVIYQNGKVKIVQEKSKERPANQKNGKYRLIKSDCDWLYNQVLGECLGHHDCNNISFSRASDPEQLYKTGLDIEKFNRQCKQVCKLNQKPSRTEFGNSICERK